MCCCFVFPLSPGRVTCIAGTTAAVFASPGRVTCIAGTTAAVFVSPGEMSCLTCSGIRVSHEKYYTALLYAAIIQTRTHRQITHAPYTRILGHTA